MSEYQNNSIFWVEIDKILPNPFQPRRDFDANALEDLADSIKQYGVLQPLVVTRQEIIRPDGAGMDVFYELIAGERRLRASKIARLQQVPVIIRVEPDNKVKLELAIIENLQREDLNPIDRALAFEQLHKEFNLTHVEIGKRMGKSRVYVSNSLRLLSLPEDIKKGLLSNKITEGHTRPLLMLSDRPDEQSTLFREIVLKKISVRDAEKVARKIAQDRVRKKEFITDPKIRNYEKELSENLGTRVHIEAKENGGQILINYSTLNDIEGILASLRNKNLSSFNYLNPKEGRIERQENNIPNVEALESSSPLRVEKEEPFNGHKEEINTQKEVGVKEEVFVRAQHHSFEDTSDSRSYEAPSYAQEFSHDDFYGRPQVESGQELRNVHYQTRSYYDENQYHQSNYAPGDYVEPKKKGFFKRLFG